MSAFATVADVQTIAGKIYTEDEKSRIEYILPLLSDALRTEAKKAGMDLDALADSDESYLNTIKLVTCDIAARFMRQATDGEPLTQESQAANGYSWSGTYAIPGGGISGSIMRNDLRRLGIRRQKLGVIELYTGEE